MPKRFTATEKWDDPWFFSLSNESKLFWFYLLDKVNHAGIWDPNFEIAEAYLKFKPVMEPLGERIVRLASGKYFIPRFIEFQYGALNRENRAHNSALNVLEKEGASKGLISPLQAPYKPLISPLLAPTLFNKDTNKYQYKGGIRGDLIPPDFDVLKAYCANRGGLVDPSVFFDFYQSKGWLVGKNKMKDWRAAVRTWEKKSNGTNKYGIPGRIVGHAAPNPGKYAGIEHRSR